MTSLQIGNHSYQLTDNDCKVRLVFHNCVEGSPCPEHWRGGKYLGKYQPQLYGLKRNRFGSWENIDVLDLQHLIPEVKQLVAV